VHVHGAGHAAHISKGAPVPRRKLLRRFEPRYGVSLAMVEEEAKYLRREIEDYASLSSVDAAAKRADRHRLVKQSWEHLNVCLTHLPERERCTLQCLFFRDVYHILKLYLSVLCPDQSESPVMPTSAPITVPKPADAFSEFLFDL
jgi:hypothetical protein